MKRFSFALFLLSMLAATSISPAAIIIDHNDTDITAVPQDRMQLAKDTLHIAYGHTSHGSQVTTGMNGLVGFANGEGKGLSLPPNFFAWNNGGINGALDLHDGAMDGDVGYYPQWVENTTDYLDNSANADVNVIMWSWCGQVDSKYDDGLLDDHYLIPMAQLEATYSDVHFVYMTGHVDHWDDANNKAANQMIRDYCLENDKILYDFADIECYDPDGTFYEYPHDNCDYYAGPGGSPIGNWATEWQDTHTEGVDWYDCGAAHSESLNANQKAYAAWALFAEIAMREAGYIPGDANQDGQVDGSDVTIVAANWQLGVEGHVAPPVSWSDGDFNGDGRVDGSDVTILATNWQYGVLTSAAAVPEPSTIVLLMAGIVCYFFHRRTR